MYCICPIFIYDRARIIDVQHPPHSPRNMRSSPLARAGVSGSNLRLTMTYMSTATTLLVVFQLVTRFPYIGAIHLEACGTRLQEQQDAAWNVTHHAEPPPPLRLSYEQCLVECGTGMGSINLQSFSGDFGAWLLPWISLMFQIPFGSEREFQCCHSRVTLN